MAKGISGVRYIRVFIILFLSLFCQAYGKFDDDDAFSSGEIITAEMIKRSGLIRIGDILQFADRLFVNSTDGYTWRISPNGLSPFQRQNWIVILDGQKIDLSAFDLIHLNMLSTVIDQIDYVEIRNHPQIHEGFFTDRGLIHIHTNIPQQGISIHGWVATGSETKDPGPYINTEFATPNVDRTLTDSSATLDFANKNWYFRTGVMTQMHSFTDLAMVRRNQSIHASDGFIELGGISSFFKMGLDTSHGRHEFLASHSTVDKYFLFFKPAGREIPVDYIIRHVGINGDISISENLGLKYRLNYATNQLDKSPNTLDFDFDWKSINYHANMEGNFEWGEAALLRVGVGFDRFRLDTTTLPDSVDVGKIYGTVNYNLVDNFQQGLDVLIAFSDGKGGIKSALTNNWKINKYHEFSTILSFSQRLFEEDNSLWYWSQRGYDLLEENDLNYTIIGDIDKSEQFTIDLIWEYNLNSQLSLETGGSYRFFDGIYLERQDFDFRSEDCSFSSPTRIYADQSGGNLGGHLALAYRPVHQLDHRFFYSYRATIAGDDVFKEVWQSIPKHKASYRLTYTPVQNFLIWGMLSYLSESHWVDYENVDGEFCEFGRVHVRYSATVKGAAVFDLQFKKWFWGRRLQASLLFRNVWDKDFRYHPVGASFDRSFYVQLKGFFSR